jgi:hypothetical protein
MKMACILPTDLREFAAALVWYECPERYIRNEQEYKDFLVLLLAKTPATILSYAKQKFQITDEDLIESLKTAKPGIFVYEDEWLKCNEDLGIDPPLPFPRKKWAR